LGVLEEICRGNFASIKQKNGNIKNTKNDDNPVMKVVGLFAEVDADSGEQSAVSYQQSVAS